MRFCAYEIMFFYPLAWQPSQKVACISLGTWKKNAEILHLMTHLRPKALRGVSRPKFCAELKINGLFVTYAYFGGEYDFLVGRFEF